MSPLPAINGPDAPVPADWTVNGATPSGRSIFAARRIPVTDLPADTPETIAEVLRQVEGQVTTSPYISRELRDLAILYDGGAAALSNDYFVCPSGVDMGDWQDMKSRLLVYINLLKACTRRLRSAVLGGSVRRRIVRNPYEDEINRMMRASFRPVMRQRLSYSILFGTSYAVPTLCSGRIVPWLPYPPTTRIITEPGSADRVMGIAAYTPDASTLRIVTADGLAVIRPGKSFEIQPANFGFLPVTIGFGEDRTAAGETYGLSLVREAAKALVRACDCLMNVAVLQKIRTRGVFWIRGLIETEGQDLGQIFGPNGIAPLEKDGAVGFATPDSNIPDSLEVLHATIYALSLSVGIPIDDLNPVFKGLDGSAEAARRRAVPLTAITQELTESCIADEEDFILRSTALLAWSDTFGRPVDLDDLSDAVATEIDIDPTILPESNSERVSNEIQLWSIGARTDEDLARAFNRSKDDAEIATIAAEIRRRREASSAQSIAQAALKSPLGPTSASPGTPSKFAAPDESDESEESDPSDTSHPSTQPHTFPEE